MAHTIGRTPQVPPPEGVVDDVPALPRCVYSTSSEGDIAPLLGQPHYSYRFAEAKFRGAFAAAGVALSLVRMPEYHATAASLDADPATKDSALGPGGLVHLMFRSTEQFRLLKPARNIACYAWEFEVLRDWTAPGEHPFLNQVRMLALCDEIWVPCRFTRDVLRRHGLTCVHVIPAPLQTAPDERLSRADALAAIGHVGTMPLVHNFLLSPSDNARAALAGARSLIDVLAGHPAPKQRPLVYLSILNPEDFRKNLDAMLRGFHHFQQEVGAAVLIVKVLTAAERFALERVVAEVVPAKLAGGSVFASEHIVFLNRFLSEAEMSALFALADFYLCTSLAEGQNLPLLEAMAHGVVPVTTANTAMADYIDPDCAFVIETERQPAPSEHLAAAAAFRPYSVDLCGPRHVYEALMRSARARPQALRARAEAALATVRRGFGQESVWPLVASRLRAAMSA